MTAVERRLVSLAEIARLADVKRPTVNNWRARHEDFPEPAATDDGKPYFRLGEICTWLDRRRVPADCRRPDEPSGATYADRVRCNSEMTREPGSSGRPGRVRASSLAGSEQELDQLLKLAASVPGAEADRLLLISSLIFLRDVSTTDEWRGTALRSEQDPPHRFLRHVAEKVAHSLHGWGVQPGRRWVLLQPHSLDMPETVRLCGRIDSAAHCRLFDEYGRAAGLGSTRFFTPECLTRLIARLVPPSEDGAHRTIFDPYARSGELLEALVLELGEEEGSTFQAATAHQEDAALACMRLAHHGSTADIDVVDAPQWRRQSSQVRADIVVTNPPFNLPVPVEDKHSTQWEFGAPSANLNYAYLQHALACLEIGGRAVVIMPTGAESSANPGERSIRKAMIESGVLEGVISLPPHLFPASNIAVSLWLLRRPHPGDVDSHKDICMIDARSTGAKIAGKQRALLQADQDAIVTALIEWRKDPGGASESVAGNVRVKSVQLELIYGPSFSLSPADHLAMPTQPRTPGQRAERLATTLLQVEQRLSSARQADRDVEELDLSALSRLGEALPAGWQRRSLGELCKLQTGPSGTRLREKVPAGGQGVTVVEAAHFTHHRINVDGAKQVTERVAHTLRSHQLNSGDILCGRSGKTGVIAMATEVDSGLIFGTNLLRLYELQDEVVPSFLLAYLSMPATKSWVKNRSKSSIPSVTAESVRELSIVLPPLPEQERIGAAFAAIDEQLRAHQALMDETTRARSALADRLFGQTLPV